MPVKSSTPKESRAGRSPAPANSGEKSWQARIGQTHDKLAERFVESISFDFRLASYDIRGSMAHARMLAKVKLISAAELAEIVAGLKAILADIKSGAFAPDIRQEDIHMAIEAALIERIGEPGRKLHTGRSRNDQVALDIRLWCIDAIKTLREAVMDVQKSLLKLAGSTRQFAAPAYTHLQRAQPIVFAHELLAYVEMLERDRLRLWDCATRTFASPLGSGAVAGSTLPIDRRFTAKILDMPLVTRNSLDSVGDRDFAIELVFDMAMIAMHLSRFAEQWIIYSSTEFDFIRLADQHTTGSSMMPQKRNPDMLELIRGKAGGVYGQLMALLTMFKGLPISYNRDMQEDKRLLFAAFDAILPCLQITADIVAGVRINKASMAARIDDGFPDATVLAEYLVKKGVAFRTAHQMVGKLVAFCDQAAKRTLSDLTLEQMHTVCPEIGEDVYAVLGSVNVVAAYQSDGSGSVQSVELQIKWWKRKFYELAAGERSKR